MPASKCSDTDASQPRRKPRQERSRFTVAAILQATERLLGQRGLGGTGMRAIARRAGVSAGSLYQYYDNKSSVIGSLIDQRFAADLRKVEAALEVGLQSPLEQAVTSGIALLVPSSEFQKNAMVAMADSMGAVEGSARLQGTMEELVRLMAMFLEKHPELEIDEPARVARTLVYSIRESAFAAMREPGPYEPVPIRKDMACLAMGYLSRVQGAS